MLLIRTFFSYGHNHRLILQTNPIVAFVDNRPCPALLSYLGEYLHYKDLTGWL